jgi:hypothetical protein
MVLASGRPERLRLASNGVIGSAWLRFKEMQSVVNLSGTKSISRLANGSHRLNANGIHTILEPRW